MVTINNAKLQAVIEEYKGYFPEKWEDEVYKWEAVKCFQDNWDVEAEDFRGMWMRATAKANNLLTSFRSYPRGMIEAFSGADEASTRAMFAYLFNEDVDLETRVKHFINAADVLKDKYGKNESGEVIWNQHFQNLNSISTYLWLKYPDKYFIYKVSEIKNAATILESSFVPKNGQKPEYLTQAFDFFKILREALKKDSDISALREERLSDECYPDPEYNTQAIDLDFYISRYYSIDQQGGVRYWTYSPGKNASEWEEFKKEGIMGLGWSELGDLSQYDKASDIRDRFQEITGDSKSHMNDKCANWDFANKMKIGDIVFAKQGMTRVIGRGIVDSDYVWDDSRKSFKSIRKVRWTHTDEHDINFKMAQKTLTDITYYPEMCKKLNDLFEGIVEGPYEPSGKWWICANPEMWKVSELAVGDTQNYTKVNEKGNPRQIKRNFDSAKVGDKIIIYEANPTKKILALAELTNVTDQEIFMTKTFDLSEPVTLDEIKSIPELEDLEFLKSANGSLFLIKDKEYDIIMDLIKSKNEVVDNPDTKETPSYPEYTKEMFLSKVFMTENSCDELIGLLKRKKNIILQGAPGVGKTFAAKRLAYLMMGCKDDSRIDFIQFHQSVSYESFIEGYKPSDNSFHISQGIFHNFCKKAAADKDKRPYFFIIDEINRGNLSKIFGELLSLIEVPYRGEKHAKPLNYSGIPFFVPENLYIIGMMNTADRSLAIIDYALRRRFAFFEMNPGFNSQGFQDMQQSISNEKYDHLVKAVVELNERIKEDLGEGFQIGHSYFCASPEDVDDLWLQTVAKYEIIPLIKEYWFDNSRRVKEESERIIESVK